MNTKVNMKQLLIDLEGLDFSTLDEGELIAIVYEMLEHLGDTDAELREGLIAATLMRIVGEGILSREQSSQLLEECLGERHLFYNLGERGDSIFMRSYSALLVASLINADAQFRFLSEDGFANVKSKCIEYLEAEMDTRGHVEGKGWAHAIAHGADMLLALAKHPLFTPQDFPSILETIEACLFKKAAYVDAEDKRFIFVLRAMKEKGFEDQMLGRWIERICNKLNERYKVEGFSYKYHRMMTNVENFMKSLYFYFKTDRNGLYIRVLLFDNIKALPYNRANF